MKTKTNVPTTVNAIAGDAFTAPLTNVMLYAPGISEGSAHATADELKNVTGVVGVRPPTAHVRLLLLKLTPTIMTELAANGPKDVGTT